MVDELCEKLKDFQSGGSESKEKTETESKPDLCIDSPLDLAKRYYAAFPPLKSNSNLITLLPHLCGKRRANRRVQQNRSNSCGDKLHQRRFDSDNMKSRCGGKPRAMHSFRSKKDFGFTRSMEKTTNLSDWDVYLTNRQNRADEGYSTSDTNGVDDIDEPEEKRVTTDDDKHLEAKLVAKFDRRIEALWDNDQRNDGIDEYQDLPVDIQGLLESPTKPPDVESMNVANTRSVKQSFIQCGTNITSSIWSDYGGSEENAIETSLYDSYLYNEDLDTANTDTDQMLGNQFNYLSMGIDHLNDNIFTDKTASGENINLLYDNSVKLSKDFTSLPWELAYPEHLGNKKWSDAENYSYSSPSYKRNSKAVSESLLTLNHNDEESCFKEVVPKQVLGLPTFSSYYANQPNTHITQEYPVKEEEDLLTSARTHFKPIKQEGCDTAVPSQGQYADGTTFAIKGSLEQVNYKRSESGTLYLETEFDTPKKYMEYKSKDVSHKWEDDDSCCSIEREFILKFCVKQNEKCCQTDMSEITSASPQEVPAKKRVLCDPEEFFFPGDEELLCENNDSDDACECSCSRVRTKLATNLEPLFNSSSETCTVHGNRPDSSLDEIAQWTNNNWKKCDKCNNNWSSLKPKADQEGLWKSGIQSWQQIWSSSEELCRTCLGVPAGPGTHSGRSVEYFKLREELSQDGEQLLSDLSCLQRVYMEQLPVAEVSIKNIHIFLYII